MARARFMGTDTAVGCFIMAKSIDLPSNGWFVWWINHDKSIDFLGLTRDELGPGMASWGPGDQRNLWPWPVRPGAVWDLGGDRGPGWATGPSQGGKDLKPKMVNPKRKSFQRLSFLEVEVIWICPPSADGPTANWSSAAGRYLWLN